MPQKAKYLSLILLLVLASIFSGLDLLIDLTHGASPGHSIQEAIALLYGLGILFWLCMSYLRQQREIKELKRDLAAIRATPVPASAEFRDAKKKLAELIVEQFATWQLTDSEKEIAQFLLKGFSLKEIAALRGTAEKTIRQQASSIYQKSGTSGRHAFAAWFMEDLL